MLPAVLLWLLALPALAADSLSQLLNADPPPNGVVIELVEGEEDALGELLPKVREAIAQLRQRYPDLEIAVVTHGGEQFALQSSHQQEYASIHQGVQQLVEEDVPVHVCGTHAGWYDVQPEDFPAYVDVAPSGPAQINQYRELGYSLLRIKSD